MSTPEHDQSYKLLFSHPELVRDLLIGFVDQPWVADLDFSSLEAIQSSFVSDDLKARHDDVIWRVRYKTPDDHESQWLYLYILLEFQSTIDRFMAVRLMTYIGLLYQNLIKQQPPKHDEKLPPVVPIVLYNGSRRWNSPTQLDALIEPLQGFQSLTPQLGYILLDESHYKDQEKLEALDNLVAAIFQLESNPTVRGVERVLRKLLVLLPKSEQEPIRRSYVTWLRRVLIPKHLPNARPIPALATLEEVHSMLAETVQGWWDEAEQLGFAKGREEGREEGITEGKAKTLLHFLELRFGEQSDSVKQRIAELNEQQIDQCLEYLMRYPSTLQDFLSHTPLGQQH